MSTLSHSRIRRTALLAGIGLVSIGAHAQSWTLALSWKAGSCDEHNGTTTCIAPAANRVPAGGADADEAAPPTLLKAIALRTDRIDCDATALAADSLPAGLERYVSSTSGNSLQQRWSRYGSCSGYTPAGYFAEIAAMARAVGRTNLGQYLEQHAGKRVALDELKDAQLHDFFFGADKAVQFYCAPDGRLAEVRYTLRDWSDMFVYRDRGSLLVPTPGGNCGDEVIL
jgi:ribonuclease I